MNPAFIAPIYILILFGGVFFITYGRGQEQKRLTAQILSLFKGRIIETINDIKAESLVSGKRSKDAEQSHFKRCDVYILPDAVFIATYLPIFGMKVARRPLLITKNITGYSEFLASKILPDIKKINPDSFSKSVYIEYGESSLKNHSADIHLYGLTDAQRDYFRF
ncbi:hypothetical protein [Flavobacterium psychrotrophum]|uniref:hypothetical protein n=1 Tax=Flavobacterium psychrotrophum TaxID=2294119 RepID=UPI000E312FEC|nr:hypothetical protein [Flavobacterium psychrotrophum]